MKRFRRTIIVQHTYEDFVEAHDWQEAQDDADETNLIDLQLDEPVDTELLYIDVEEE